MDTLSHALVGLALAGLSGHNPALNDSLYIATILGAQAPDFDIIAQVRGNVAYLRQHRAFSHSFPGIAIWSIAISCVIQLFMPQAAFGQTFAWAFAGGLSHIIIDYFNTHGVAILWPFRKERKSYPLLNVFDPILLVIMLTQYASRAPMLHISLTTFATLIIYILSRYLLRLRAGNWLKKEFANQTVSRVWVMPSLNHLLHWDFVVETERGYLNGRVGALYPVMAIQADLPKKTASPLTVEAQKTTLGEFFRSFTPFSYFEEHPDLESQKVTIYDLRYFANKQFIHSATIIFDSDNAPCESYIHSLGHTIKVQTAAE